MSEISNGKKIPEAEFTFREEVKNEVERKNELNVLLKKRNELLALLGIKLPNNLGDKTKKISNDYFSQDKKEEIKEKMEAGIIGFVVGDALGVPVEFMNRISLQKNLIKEMIGYGSHNVPEGTWSDDSSLMLATMDSIKEMGEINFEDIMYKFTEWIDTAKYTATDRVFDIGFSTSQAISNYKKGINAVDCGMKGVTENGNGSLMRILPFVYYIKFSDLSDNEKTSVINQASSLTHAHEISRLGCKIFSDYVCLLIDGIDKEEALEQIKKNNYKKYYSNESLYEYRRILKGDIRTLNINEIKSSGYVVHSLEASLWCTLKNSNYEEAVVAAVNLGEDTDTIGAITGALNGIIYGKSSIPQRWLKKIKKFDYLTDISNQYVNAISSNKKNKSL